MPEFPYYAGRGRRSKRAARYRLKSCRAGRGNEYGEEVEDGE